MILIIYSNSDVFTVLPKTVRIEFENKLENVMIIIYKHLSELPTIRRKLFHSHPTVN